MTECGPVNFRVDQILNHPFDNVLKCELPESVKCVIIA